MTHFKVVVLALLTALALAGPVLGQDLDGTLKKIKTSGTLTIAPGQTRQTISVAVIGDRIGEEIEPFAVVLSSPTGAILLNDSATGLISDDEPRIAGNSVEVIEGNSGTVTAFATVSLSNAYDQDVTVN